MISFEKDPLRYVLNLAYQHAMTGKGQQRHGDFKPFCEQIWTRITRCCGLGFPIGQAMKKVEEAQRMNPDAAIQELLGGIVYLSMAVIDLMKEAKK